MRSRTAAFACALAFTAYFAYSCDKNDTVLPNRSLASSWYTEREAARMMATMTLEEKAAQVIMVSVPGNSPSGDAFKKRFAAFSPGAVILFQFNVAEDAAGVREYVAALQDAAMNAGMKIPPLVAIDHEGGTVLRTGNALVKLPSARKVAEKVAPESMGKLGELVGKELRAVGITWILGPVVEHLTEANKGFLGTRAYSSNPVFTATVASRYSSGLARGGVLSCAKHFPGNADTDPHFGLPVLKTSLERLQTETFPGFREALLAGSGSVMLSHALVPALDGKNPSSLSPETIRILKDRLGLKGIALTDDLEMKAVMNGDGVGKTAVRALKAGADMVMISSGKSAETAAARIVAAVLSGDLHMARLDDAVGRVIRQKLAMGIFREWDQADRERTFAQIGQTQEESRKLLGL